MSPLEIALLVLAALALVRAVHVRRVLRTLRDVPRGDDAGSDVASLAVVAAARDEAEHVESAVASWLSVRVPQLEVVVVDDRSRDATPAILERLAAVHDRLSVVRLDERPSDWLGKCHALHRGAERVEADWLLFTDADVRLDPERVRDALAWCERDGLDHLTLLPRVHVTGILQEAFTGLFFQAFLVASGVARAERPGRGAAVGIGAFNLVRRSAYEAVGGHREIRLQVGDDVALGRLIARAGYRQRVAWGLDVAELEWQRGLRGTIRGLEKNAFWGLRFSWLALLALTALSLLHLAPLAGVLLATPASWCAFAAWWAGIGATYATALVPAHRAAACALLHPVSVALMLVTLWGSALATTRRGGVRWRDDLVPTPLLRSELKPLRWWLGPIEPRR